MKDTLANKLRERLAKCGYCSNDLDLKTLKKCDRIFTAMDYLHTNCQNHLNEASKCEINYCTVAEQSKISRKTLSENVIYRTIIEVAKSNRLSEKTVPISQYEKKCAELASFKKKEKDMDETIKKQLGLNIELAELKENYRSLEKKYQEYQSELSIARKQIQELQAKTKEVEDIQKQNSICS